MFLEAALIGGTALSVYGQLKGASEERRMMDDKATFMRAQAARRLSKGKQQADSIISQGKMSQTQYATGRLSAGTDRETLAQDTSLSEISNRAQYEADLAMEDASYEAQMLREDADVTSKMGRSRQEAAGIGAVGSILGAAYSYNKGTK